MRFPRSGAPLAIHFGKKEVRVHAAINLFILVGCCSVLLAGSITSFATQINQALNHPPIQRENGCNGHPELCNRRYSEITQIGAHESAFVGILPSDNQNYDVTVQLDSGIRFLQVQTHKNYFGQLGLCHTHCLMENAGLLSHYLATIKAWLDTHPQEVVTVLLTTHDTFNMTAFDKAFVTSGIRPYAYTPPLKDFKTQYLPLNGWPTLAQLIAANTRLVTFMDYGAPDLAAPYILPEFQYFWETPFDQTERATLAECNMDRPAHLKNAATTETRRYNYIVNHFLDTEVGGITIPDRRDAARTNSWDSIGRHVEVCERKWGRKPGVVLVDFFEKGEVVRAQDVLNGLVRI